MCATVEGVVSLRKDPGEEDGKKRNRSRKDPSIEAWMAEKRKV